MGIFDKLKGKKTPKADEKPADVKSAKKDDAKVAKKSDKKVTEKKPAAIKATDAKIAYDVLVRPAITEKSFQLQVQNKYVFFVNNSATKTSVKRAVKEAYQVEPTKVRIINIKPSKVTRWGRTVGTHKAQKKAIVTVPKGTTLTLS